jgi:arsenate reductase
MFSNLSRIIAEFAGAAILTCVVIGSGIMGDRLSSDDGISLIINAFSPVSALVVLILVLGPISGAHFNPVVSLVAFASKAQKLGRTIAYIIAQMSGAILGAVVGNVMFDVPAIEFSLHERVSAGTLLGEVIATAGLIAVIGILAAHKQEKFIVWAVAGWILPAIFFTSSTSFANPAVTIGRQLSNTFAGISPNSVLPFIGAQLVGGLAGFLLTKAVLRSSSKA